eukprot:CAMPEP_0174960040 /NCGR_PEP_ID=MMETSP0004_2-20121128/3495_1 /TAXON_ID=420556 /ORGANISM="Ochromonas sp., Strain CCMP1393" /LENGTH=400 /DNA_ID=CAMNT_0016208393 /DNA_START=728 /DNA_END=1933 /DNA_ORIENTATION=+
MVLARIVTWNPFTSITGILSLVSPLKETISAIMSISKSQADSGSPIVEATVFNQESWVAGEVMPDIIQHDLSTAINEPAAREFLTANKWPLGLQDTFLKNLARIPMRFFICDDSGSMSATDGHKLMSNGSVEKMVTCTRWQELTEGLKFHATLAHVANAKSEFRLLNGAQPIRVGMNDVDEESRFAMLMAILDNSPSGQTPLCRHIREVVTQIQGLEQELRASGRKACVIIASDGESSDGDIVSAMRPLRSLPVWAVVRLCTDEDRVVEYWNNIDSQLEMDMDVLDDLSGEAQEVYANNSWLTYGEPLHRLREFGVLIKEMDIMDSDKLSLDQVRIFCSVLFGGNVDNYPHPELDFKAFVTTVAGEAMRAPEVWDPVSKKRKQWIDKRKLAKLNGACTIS